MKKVMDLVKPYLSLIFGVLFFLLYLNYLRADGEVFAIGLVAVIISSYYLCVGILGIVLGDKMPEGLKKVFGILSVSLFPAFMFVNYLLMIIRMSNYMGPTAWVIYPLCMGASIGLVGFYVVSRFVKNPVVTRLAGLFAAIFVLALIADLLFDAQGDQNTFGNIGVVSLLVSFIFAFLLFNSLSLLKLLQDEYSSH